MKNIAIFASGSGTNAECIANYFANIPEISIRLILSNKEDAGVLKRAEKFNIPTFVFNRNNFYSTSEIIEKLEENGIDLIVLAGFLWLVPENILAMYRNRIINIHPALLPDYGGKGMYGHHVHEAVITADEKLSGITIHFVNEKYDAGQIIFQKEIKLNPDETSESLASKIHELEYKYYPKVIEEVISGI